MPIPLVIRALRREDTAAFLGVHRASVHGLAAADYAPDVIMDWAPLPVSADAVSALLQAWDSEFRTIAEERGRPVGIGALAIEKAELTACYVHPAHANRGIGTAIADRLESIALEAGITVLKLDSSTTAERFYKARGYDVVARGEHLLSTGRAMAAIRMRKRLVPSA